MDVSGCSFLIFVLVLIFISTYFVDSLVPTLAWTLLWAIYVYAKNLWSTDDSLSQNNSINTRNVAAQQQRGRAGLVATRLQNE